MTPWHAVALTVVSVLLLHGFVYTVGFAGQEERPDYAGFWLTFLHFTIAGYGIALLVSLYVLWTFERTVGVSLDRDRHDDGGARLSRPRSAPPRRA